MKVFVVIQVTVVILAVIGETVWVKDNTIVFGWTLVPYSKNLEKTHHTIKFDQIKFKGYDINIKIKLIKNND